MTKNGEKEGMSKKGRKRPWRKMVGSEHGKNGGRGHGKKIAGKRA